MVEGAEEKAGRVRGEGRPAVVPLLLPAAAASLLVPPWQFMLAPPEVVAGRGRNRPLNWFEGLGRECLVDCQGLKILVAG